MKRNEQIAHLQKLSPADIRKEIADLEAKMQSIRFALAFGKSKHVSEIHNLRKQLARTITIGNQKIRAMQSAPAQPLRDAEKVENDNV